MRGKRLFCTAATLLVTASNGSAQTTPPTVPSINTGFPASNNVGGGALSNRSPGTMVSAGVSRAQNAVALPRPDYSNITETEPSPSPRVQLLTTLIDAAFEEIDNLIAYFSDLLMRRAGLSDGTTPTPPADNANDSNSSGNASDSANTTENPRNTGARKGLSRR